MNPWPQIEPGDHLLYGVQGFDIFNRITRLKTWSPAVHIEQAVSEIQSVASRNGLGVNLYPIRTKGLIAILTPNQFTCLEDGMKWFNVPYNPVTHEGVRGRPYGFWDLLEFYNIHIPTDGWICSQFISLFDEACGFQPFAPGYFDGRIDPGDYFVTNAFTWKWVDPKALKMIQRF